MRTEQQKNKEIFCSMSQEDLLAKARSFDADRRVRAVQQIAGYRLIGEGTLLNQSTGESYECEDVRRWKQLPGVVVYVGCDCPDEVNRLRPLREAMAAKGCGTPCYCKHSYLRLLLAGHSLKVGDLTIKAKARLLK